MKPIKEITACVIDYGSFISLAGKLTESFKKVYYYSPHDTEYRDVNQLVIGDGIPNLESADEYITPELMDEVDLYIFPDIGFSSVQRFLARSGKAVWGAKEANRIELYRSEFLDLLQELGLPVPECQVVVGLEQLKKALMKTKDKWIKIDVFRENMETWHHVDYEHSIPVLRYLETTFGGVSEEVVFTIQSPIDNAEELGYDGFTIDGAFPNMSFQGYEKKNELYLGSALEYDDLPDNIKEVNEAFSPFLREHEYRNFFATELRNEFFIDPTTRMAGQTQEQLIENCTNLAEIIWSGANGVLIEPEFKYPYAAEATLHYKQLSDRQGWKKIKIPPNISKWFKLYHYCQNGDEYNFPPYRNDELGVVIGLGDSIEESIANLKEHLDGIKDEPVEADLKGFSDLVVEISAAQSKGIKFSDDPIPSPEAVVNLIM